MVDLSRLMQDAATLEVIEKSAIEAQVLRHDVEAYRACLGYTVSGDHDGRLSDGTLPNNGIAEALNNECRTLSAQNSAQAMQIDELERELSSARAELETVTLERADYKIRAQMNADAIQNQSERAERAEAALEGARKELDGFKEEREGNTRQFRRLQERLAQAEAD